MKAFLLSCLISVAFGSFGFAQNNLGGEPTTVPSVDLQKYQGKWFEIARVANSFQEKCVGPTTAVYTILKNGQIKVENRCQLKDGKIDLAEGRAKSADQKTNSKLKVTFAKILGNWVFAFGGDYWIMELDPQYRWVVVGAPDRKFGWILARTPELDLQTLDQIESRIKAQGYDSCQFVVSPQDQKSKLQGKRLCDI